MNNTLHWKVPSRAQSAASTSSAWNKSSATLSPGAETAEPLYGVEFSPQTNEGNVVNRYVQSPDTATSVSALCSRPSSGPPRQTSSTKRYWKLGGLGPTSVANPEWQVHKERLMAMKAFGKAANEANRLARLRALGKEQYTEAERETQAFEIDANDAEEKDKSITLLEERAKKRDIGLALKL
jgi:hypothetical protein